MLMQYSRECSIVSSTILQKKGHIIVNMLYINFILFSKKITFLILLRLISMYWEEAHIKGIENIYYFFPL